MEINEESLKELSLADLVAIRNYSKDRANLFEGIDFKLRADYLGMCAICEKEIDSKIKNIFIF